MLSADILDFAPDLREKKKKNSLSVMFVVDFYVVFFIDALCQVEEVLFLRVIMNGY